MCIRDSISFYPEDALALDALAREKNVTAVVDCGVAPGLCTVSYTHLRAHETVLDLVCRLLLEKKNNS